MRYQEIKDQLIQAISQLEPGTRLPSRPTLCKELDTNRTTLDRAIKELESEGVLRSRNGSGTYVIGLVQGKVQTTENWGVIVPNVMDHVYPSLARGIENIACRYSTNVILCNSDDDAEKQYRYIQRLLLSGVSGFIIVPVITSSAEIRSKLYGALLASNIPFVFCHRGVEGIRVPIVKSNDFYGGYLATKHLISRGYRNIAYIAKQEYSTSIERYQGYVSALQEYGLPVERRRIFLPQGGLPNGSAHFIAQLLQTDSALDGVFCFNDYVALEVCKAIKAAGKRISGDIGVIGYDNLPVDSSVSPKITSLAFKSLEIGEKAAEILYEMINHRMTGSGLNYYLFQPTLIPRESCLGLETRKNNASEERKDSL